MTEQEWLACTDPTPMVQFISRRRKPGKVNERLWTLFACACCRRIWHLIPTETCQHTVEVAERHVDGLASEEERFTAWSSAFTSAEEEGIRLDYFYGDSELIDWGYVPGGLAVRATLGLVGEGNVTADEVARNAAAELYHDAIRMGYGEEASREIYTSERTAQSQLLRDIFHNPFRNIALDSSWLSWNHGTVLNLARRIYAHRTFDRLQLLADTLKEASCDNLEILNHCRFREHVRGCWVIDRILGKR